jgi:superfamily I DNA/RNA helicase
MPYYFNLPIYTRLTRDQQTAVDETEPIALSGGPGTGKSVVCLWRHIRNYETGARESLLLTYTKTLEHYLKRSARAINEDAADNISRTYYWTYNEVRDYKEIIIDEGQDVEIGRYNTIKMHADTVCYGADEAQSLYNGCTPVDLAELFPDNEEITLQKNFRNSKEILEFTKSIFPGIFISQETINNSITTEVLPIMKIIGWDKDDEIEAIMSIINDFQGDTHNIGVLLPGGKQVDDYYTKIKENLDNDIECSKYQSEHDEFRSLSGIHVTTYKSSKGTEFDTVIMPNFDSYQWFIDNTDNITDNDYYVAFTRTKTNLFLICKKNPRIGNSSTYEIE